MTLAIAMVTPTVALAAADRRYSGVGRLKAFKATKICSLETTDAQGLLTFAGVGARATAEPFELSDWVTHVLRGYKRSLDESLRRIAGAAGEQGIHEHAPGHAFAFAGFIERKMTLRTVSSQTDFFSMQSKGSPHRLDVQSSPHPFRVINFEFPPHQRMGCIVLGTGVRYLNANTLIGIARQVRRAKTKEEEGQRFAAYWSAINRSVAMHETTVGPEVVCGWRYKNGGGGHTSFLANGGRDASSTLLPAVGQGMPISDLVRAIMPDMLEKMQKWHETGEPPNIDSDEMNALLKNIRMEPKTKF